MPTPHPGTVRQLDVETIYPPPRQESPSNLKLIVQLIEISISSCVHTITCCALGRFLLDHFHLWHARWTVPPDAPSIEKHAELIAAFLAGCLAGPGTYGVAIVVDAIDTEIRRRRPLMRLPETALVLWGIYFFALWTLLVITGAILHTRFRYLTVGSILGVYGFGSLILFLPSLGLAVRLKPHILSDWIARGGELDQGIEAYKACSGCPTLECVITEDQSLPAMVAATDGPGLIEVTLGDMSSNPTIQTERGPFGMQLHKGFVCPTVVLDF
ncbi:hypothetical protein DL96DRAFT_1689011 [Flagelloscypha sp. PMI_526]|nr:hypothetical protein DL96DRAFT_1689011 [Flagelloscypha sp. PMI_526]